jgi:hypothetical protein
LLGLNKWNTLGFFFLEFVVVLVSLTITEAAGLGVYSGFIAGAVAALAAVFGSALFFRRQTRSPETS